MLSSLYQHPNAPLKPTGVTGNEDNTGAVDLAWMGDAKDKAYVIHCSPANDSNTKNAIYMFYSETPNYRFTPSKLQVHEAGDKLYFWVQAFHVTGTGNTETEKAQDLNANHLGSAWSEPVEMTMIK